MPSALTSPYSLMPGWAQPQQTVLDFHPQNTTVVVGERIAALSSACCLISDSLFVCRHPYITQPWAASNFHPLLHRQASVSHTHTSCDPVLSLRAEITTSRCGGEARRGKGRRRITAGPGTREPVNACHYITAFSGYLLFSLPADPGTHRILARRRAALPVSSPFAMWGQCTSSSVSARD